MDGRDEPQRALQMSLAKTGQDTMGGGFSSDAERRTSWRLPINEQELDST